MQQCLHQISGLSAGYNLNFAKMNATWGEHQPAYYVATHAERKELLVAVRGTWEVNNDSPALQTLCYCLATHWWQAFRAAQGGVSGQQSHALKASWLKLLLCNSRPKVPASCVQVGPY